MRRPRLLLAIFAAACSPGAFCQSAIEVAVSWDPSVPAPAIEALVTLGDQRLLGDNGAVRWSVEARGSAVTSGGLGGSMRAVGEVSHAAGGNVAVGRIGIEAAADTAAGPTLARGELGATFVANGDVASFTVAPWLVGQVFADPLVEAGAAMHLSLLADSLVIEPGMAASAGLTSAAGVSVTFEPGLGFSWYPAVPLALTFRAHWAGTIGQGGLGAAEWGGTMELSGAPFPGVLAAATATFLADGAAGSSVAAGLEMSLQVWSDEERWISLPLRVAAVFSEQLPPAMSAALGARLAW